MVISINETNSTYEPYTGGIPSPSSDYPQEIKSVVNPVVKVCGKNLMPYPKDSTVTRNGVTLTVKDGIYILTGKPTAPTWFNLYPEVKNTTSKTMLSDIPLRTKDKKIVMVNGETGYSVSFRRLSNVDATISIGNNERKIADEDTVGIFLYISNTDVNYDSTFNIMITDPADSETYEPYIEQTIQLPYTLNAIPVLSGGNVTIDGQQYIADRIVEKDGVLGIERRVIDISKDLSSDSMDFDGSNEKTNKIVYHVNHKLKDSIYPCASDILPWKIVWNVDEEGIYVDSDSVIIRIDKTRCGTEEQAAKEWMDATMSKHHLYACLSDTVFEPLDQDSQEQLKELHVNYPVTNISVTSDQLDGHTVFNYPISMANGWNYVKQQLGDTRDYIYDMETKLSDAEYETAMACVNSEYAVALAELDM